MEKVQLACFTDIELKQRQIFHSEDLIDPAKEAEKLEFIFELSGMLENQIPQDKDMYRVIDFLKNMPVFRGKFKNINKIQLRNNLRKISIGLYERGTVLYKQNKVQQYTYVIILGVVNLYNNRDGQESSSSNDGNNTQLQQAH